MSDNDDQFPPLDTCMKYEIIMLVMDNDYLQAAALALLVYQICTWTSALGRKRSF